jgi:hypothetical protein
MGTSTKLEKDKGNNWLTGLLAVGATVVEEGGGSDTLTYCETVPPFLHEQAEQGSVAMSTIKVACQGSASQELRVGQGRRPVQRRRVVQSQPATRTDADGFCAVADNWPAPSSYWTST